MIKKYLVVALFLLPFVGIAQSLNYNFYNYSTENGLPTDDYQHIYHDSYGFLWIASFDGLLRWDGYTFKKYNYDEKHPGGLDNNIVYTIFEDAAKRLWVGTIEGLNLYDRSTDRFMQCSIRGKDKIPVKAISEDSKHQLWLGTSFGLCKYDAGKRSGTWFIGKTNEDIIFCMAIDGQDNIWVGTFNSGVRKFNQQQNGFQSFSNISGGHLASGDKVISIMADRENKIWVGTETRGITILNNDGSFYKSFDRFATAGTSSNSAVKCLYEDKNQTVWIGLTRDALYYIRSADMAPQRVTNTAGNNAHHALTSIASICEDVFGNTWFASTGSGLFYTNIHKNIFSNYLQNGQAVKGLKSTVVTCFFEDALGKIWMGINGAGMLQFDPASNRFSTPDPLGLGNEAINDIRADRQGNIWIATWGSGVTRYDPVHKTSKHYANDPSNIHSLIHNDVKSVLPDDSLVWIGTHGEGLAAFNLRTQQFIHYKNNHQFPFNMHDPEWINHLYKDSKKRLWISTYSGVFVYDGKTLSHFEHGNDSTTISSNSVNMITEDAAGNIWVIGEMGLDRFDESNKHFNRYSSRYNLPTAMKAIVAANNNLLWISSNEGIVVFDPVKLVSKRYDMSDGLQNSFYQKAVVQDRKGNFYFGGPKGFNVFNPTALKPISIPSFFYFTDLYVNNELQQPGAANSLLQKGLTDTKSITLAHDQFFFSIGFTAINLYAPGKTNYSYRLQGLHDQWIDVIGERKVSFTNLPAGSYDLAIRYTNSAGEWQVAPGTLHIVILPPWWESWWFRLLMIAFVATAITIFFYLRMASVRNRNRQLKTEVAKRTSELHEMNASLIEQNDEIKMQKERLEVSNEEVMRQSNKILDQQQHILHQNEQLETTVSELEKLNATKDHFFSILAHDLKNPVSALTDIAGFMKDNLKRMERHELETYLDGMHNSAAAVYELLLNLLNWSRTQSKQMEYQPANCNLAELIRKNTRLVESQLNNKHIQVTVSINERHVILADHNMLDTVIRNIITNAIKFTDYNGRINIASRLEEDHIVLSITDSGIGMTKEQLEKLFSIDKTIVSAGTAGEKGTGLGLVISKEFIDINQGKMTVESELGKGSSFHLRLPAAKEKNNNGTTTTGNGMLQTPLVPDFWEAFPLDKLVKVKGKKILIVDDNKEMRDYLKLILSDTFEIFEAGDGHEGLRLALETAPAAIITDLLMPGMDGIEFCKAIRSGTATSHLPVLFLTSQSDENIQASGYEAGADVYLTKPVKKELLIRVILNLLQNQEKLHEKTLEKILDDSPLHQENGTINKLDETFLSRLVAFIEANISEPNLDARSLCKEMATSRTILYSKIKTLTGQTVHEFIKSVRLKKSLKLLLEGQLSISQVAFEVGFNSHSYFDKCFIRQYKMGPKEYVNRKKGVHKPS